MTKTHPPDNSSLPAGRISTLIVAHAPNWYGSSLCRLEVTAADPEQAPLPISETGYRSHFCPGAEVDAAGGPVAYILAWLDAAARDSRWKAADMARRQLSLF